MKSRLRGRASSGLPGEVFSFCPGRTWLLANTAAMLAAKTPVEATPAPGAPPVVPSAAAAAVAAPPAVMSDGAGLFDPVFMETGLPEVVPGRFVSPTGLSVFKLPLLPAVGLEAPGIPILWNPPDGAETETGFAGFPPAGGVEDAGPRPGAAVA